MIVVDDEVGVALAYDPESPPGSLRLLLTLEDGGWLIDKAGLNDATLEPTRAVSPKGLRLTAWGEMRRGH